MGEVFLAHDVVLARDVAIKVLHRNLAGDPGFVQRFRSEARAAAGLTHPNIVGVYDWGAVDGIYFMVMELVEGRSVRELLAPLGRLEPAQAADILIQVLAALEHAHAKGFVHRDIKPENILVDRKGVAKVADFGLARAYTDGHVTQAPGTVTGTAQYLAPEQIRGEPADPRTDLYSLGVVAFELLTGRVPFSGETSLAIAYKHLSGRVPRPSSIVPHLPAGLDGFVASATERDRELRPESAAEMRRDLAAETASLPQARSLAQLVADAPVVVEEAGKSQGRPERAATVTISRPEAPKAKRRRRLRTILGVAFALLALAATAWAAWAYLIPHSVQIPDLVGTQTDRARAELQASGLVVKLGLPVYSLEIKEGRVVRLIPAPGTSVERDSRVTLISSLGPRPIEVPDLRGLTVPAAASKLQAEGLRLGTQKKEFHPTIAEGRVIRAVHVAGGTAPEGSEVDLLISKGPPPIAVPNVGGRNVDAATEVLRAKGFEVKEERKYSNAVPRDVVIGQAPAPPAELPAGSRVTIIVSLGPRTFAVDSYIGLSRQAAVAAIEADGLGARVLTIPGSVGDTVIGQTPRPGTIVHAGDVITIRVG